MDSIPTVGTSTNQTLYFSRGLFVSWFVLIKEKMVKLDGLRGGEGFGRTWGHGSMFL